MKACVWMLLMGVALGRPGDPREATIRKELKANERRVVAARKKKEPLEKRLSQLLDSVLEKIPGVPNGGCGAPACIREEACGPGDQAQAVSKSGSVAPDWRKDPRACVTLFERNGESYVGLRESCQRTLARCPEVWKRVRVQEAEAALERASRELAHAEEAVIEAKRQLDELLGVGKEP